MRTILRTSFMFGPFATVPFPTQLWIAKISHVSYPSLHQSICSTRSRDATQRPDSIKKIYLKNHFSFGLRFSTLKWSSKMSSLDSSKNQNVISSGLFKPKIAQLNRASAALRRHWWYLHLASGSVGVCAAAAIRQLFGSKGREGAGKPFRIELD